MHTCKWKYMDKVVYCMTHCVTLQFPWDFPFFSFFLKFYFIFIGGVAKKKRQRLDMKGSRNEWNAAACCEIHKEKRKKKKNWTKERLKFISANSCGISKGIDCFSLRDLFTVTHFSLLGWIYNLFAVLLCKDHIVLTLPVHWVSNCPSFYLHSFIQ